MRIERIERTRIAVNWHWISQLLAPAVQIDPHRSMEEVRRGLMLGALGIASVHVENGAGLTVIEPGTFDGVFGCWMPYVVGRCKSGPKAWIKMMRQAMNYFEASARLSGCREMRIGGRDWARVLPDYESLESGVWRKVL